MLAGMVQDFWSKVHAANEELAGSVPVSTVEPEKELEDDRRIEITLNKKLMRSEYIGEEKEELQVSEEVVNLLRGLIEKE